MRVLLFLGGVLIAFNSAVYFADDEIAPFIIEKLPLAREELFIIALQIHVVAAAFSLLACIVLQSTQRMHRWLGRITGAVVIVALVPSGTYLAFFAKGGVLGTLGFLLTAAITFVAMIKAIQHARARRFVAHRRAAAHVLAQLSVAVTSRALLIAFDAAGLAEETAYLLALWLPVLGSAAFVERRLYESVRFRPLFSRLAPRLRRRARA